MFIFDECVRSAKKSGTLSGTMLDIQKDFDTVSHETILGSLRSCKRKHMHKLMVLETVLQCGGV